LLDPFGTRFALALSHGLGPTEAARVVGYANPSVAGARLGRDPRIRAIIRERRNRRLDKLASLSLCELETLIKDRKVSAAVRFNAIKLSLALAGHVEPKALETDEDALGGKPVSEMGLAELDAFIASERAKRANDARPVLDATPAEPRPMWAAPDTWGRQSPPGVGRPQSRSAVHGRVSKPLNFGNQVDILSP
jgi:phage terminase small subunit